MERTYGAFRRFPGYTIRKISGHPQTLQLHSYWCFYWDIKMYRLQYLIFSPSSSRASGSPSLKVTGMRYRVPQNEKIHAPEYSPRNICTKVDRETRKPRSFPRFHASKPSVALGQLYRLSPEVFGVTSACQFLLKSNELMRTESIPSSTFVKRKSGCSNELVIDGKRSPRLLDTIFKLTPSHHECGRSSDVQPKRPPLS